MSEQPISSFVLRFNLVGINEKTGEKQWRIRVTHVQGQEEVAFSSMAEAVRYMEEILEKK